MNLFDGRSKIANEATGPLAGRTVALTGASGRLGRRLVPELAGAGARLLLFGRDPVRLEGLFPAHECFPAATFAEHAAREPIDAVIDLATLNNRSGATLAAFREANVGRLASLAADVRTANIPLLIAISSIHAIDLDNRHPYAVSKREAREWLLGSADGRTKLLVLPKVVMANERSWRGRAWTLLGIAKPVVPVADVASAMVRLICEGRNAPLETYLAPLGRRPYLVIARALDYCVALALLVGAGWLMLLIALAVKLDSAGPAIFAQRRVGRHERTFILYKFRTMVAGTREAGTHELTAASVTRVGAVLRRLKLDELPQVINILRGELALVGPRPCLPVQRELVERRRETGIFTLRPGLTGLAQVNGVDMSDPETLVEWELRYLRMRRLLLDLRILAQTFLGRGSGDRTSL